MFLLPSFTQEGIITLEKAEEAFRREQETKEGIEEVASLCSLYHLKDVLDAAEGTDENRLLPAMNKIWPYFVACVQNRIPAVSFFASVNFWHRNRLINLTILLSS